MRELEQRPDPEGCRTVESRWAITPIGNLAVRSRWVCVRRDGRRDLHGRNHSFVGRAIRQQVSEAIVEQILTGASGELVFDSIIKDSAK